MSHDHSFFPLLIIMSLAFFVPIAVAGMRRFPLPAVVVEMILGALLGHSGLEIVKETEILSFLSLSGFVCLMFLSGLEIDFHRLNRQFRRISGRSFWKSDMLHALSIFGLTLGCSYLVADFMVDLGLAEPRSLPLLTLIFCTTSVGIVVPVLKGEEMTGSRLGQVVLLSAVVADILTISALGVVLILADRGVSWDLLLVAAFAALLLTSIKVGNVLERTGALGRVLDSVTSASIQIKVRGAFLLLLVFLVLTQLVGFEVILGAFFAGALISMFSSRNRDLLKEKLDAIGYGFFIPIFFVMVGVTFDASVLTGGWRTLELLGLLVAGAFAVKLVPAMLVLGPVHGLKGSFSAGMLLSSRLSLIIAIAAMGRKLDLVSSEFESAVILLSVATCLVSPTAFIRLMRKPSSRKNRVFMAGAGRVGREAVRRLLMQQVPITVIENDPGQLHKVPRGVETVQGHAADRATIGGLGLTPSDVFVAVTGDDKVNLEACLLARELGGCNQLIARDNNPDSTERFAREGVIPIDLAGTLATAIENMILRPDLVHLLAHENPDREAFEIAVERLPQGRKSVAEIAPDTNALVVMIRRDDDMLIPHGDTIIQRGDRLLAFGDEEDRQALCAMFGSGSCDNEPTGDRPWQLRR